MSTLKKMLAKYWILVCCAAFLLVALQDNVSLHQIFYMVIFLAGFVIYQVLCCYCCSSENIIVCNLSLVKSKANHFLYPNIECQPKHTIPTIFLLVIYLVSFLCWRGEQCYVHYGGLWSYIQLLFYWQYTRTNSITCHSTGITGLISVINGMNAIYFS